MQTPSVYQLSEAGYIFVGKGRTALVFESGECASSMIAMRHTWQRYVLGPVAPSQVFWGFSAQGRVRPVPYRK